MVTVPSDLPFRVRYFDPKLSKLGCGVREASFATQAEADAFAVGRRLYGRPATVTRKDPS